MAQGAPSRPRLVRRHKEHEEGNLVQPESLELKGGHTAIVRPGGGLSKGSKAGLRVGSKAHKAEESDFVLLENAFSSSSVHCGRAGTEGRVRAAENLPEQSLICHGPDEKQKEHQCGV